MLFVRRSILSFALLACLSALSSAVSRADSVADVADNQALDARFVSAFSAGDVDALMGVYANSPNLVVVFADGTQVRGWENVRTGYAAFFSQFTRIRGKVTEACYVPLPSGMAGFGKGYFYMTLRSGGPEQRLDFRYTNFRQKVNGAWAYTVDTMMAVAFQPLPTDRLYARIGGYDVIAQLVDDFMLRAEEDSQLADLFENLAPAERRGMRVKLVDGIASASGGPVECDGRDAFGGRKIDPSEWKRLAAVFDMSLDALHVPARERGELRQLFSAMRPNCAGVYPKRNERPAGAYHKFKTPY